MIPDGLRIFSLYNKALPSGSTINVNENVYHLLINNNGHTYTCSTTRHNDYNMLKESKFILFYQ